MYWRRLIVATLVAGGVWCGAARAADTAAPVAEALTPLQIETALGELKGDDWILQVEGMAVLGRGRVKEAVGPIRAFYDATSVPWMKGRALVALAELTGKEMAGEAEKAAKSHEAVLRSAGVQALGLIGDREAAPAVLAAVKDADVTVQAQALVAYARLLGDGAWETVAPAAASPDAGLVRAAARALRFVPGKAGRTKLLELLEHADGGVRIEAAWSLAGLKDAGAIGALLRHSTADPIEPVRVECCLGLRSFAPEALIEPLLGIFKSEEDALYDPVLRTLEFCHSQKAYDEVAQVIGHPAARYGKCLPLALELLGSADADRYRELFVQYIRDADAGTRAAAVRNLARCQQIDHFAVFRPFLADADPAVAAAAFAGLARAPRRGPAEGILAYLAEPLKSENATVNRAALELVAERLGPAEMTKAVSVLERFLAGSDEDLRALAAKAFANADDDTKTAVARLQGYVVEWSAGGPFPNDSRNLGMAVAYPPEQAVDLDKTYERGDVAATQPEGTQEFLATVKEVKAGWSPFRVKEARGRFSFNEVPYPGGGKVTYFYATFEAAGDKAIVLRLPALLSEAAVEKTALWFNGAKLDLPKPVAHNPADKKFVPVTEMAVPAALTKGTNRVLLKVAVSTPEVWSWGWYVRMVDAAGKPVEALKFKPVN